MKSYDVSLDDEMVVDSDGTIWVAVSDEQWSYLTDDGSVSQWDYHDELPAQYQPYTKLDKAAQQAIRRGMK